MMINSAFQVFKRPIGLATAQVGRRLLLGSALTLISIFPATAQNPELQAKLADVKQSAALNNQMLHQYQWLETTQLTLKGDAKPPSQNQCQYGPDGQVQKTLISAPPPPPSGGRMKQRIIEKKTDEIKQYMGEVKSLLALYVPPNPEKMQQAYDAGKMSLNPAGGMLNINFTDYAVPGDRMTLVFDTASKKIVSLAINTYMGDEKDAVTLNAQMGTIPNGPNYTQQTVLNATAKELVVTTTNSNYQKLGGY
jgi:hypothetical protein